MSCIGWNCQGLETALTVRNLKFLCGKYKPHLVFLSETKMRSLKRKRMRTKLKFDFGEHFDPVDRFGGLAIWWKASVQLEIKAITRNYIHLSKVHIDSSCKGIITFVYGPQGYGEKQRWWRHLERL